MDLVNFLLLLLPMDVVNLSLSLSLSLCVLIGHCWLNGRSESLSLSLPIGPTKKVLLPKQLQGSAASAATFTAG